MGRLTDLLVDTSSSSNVLLFNSSNTLVKSDLRNENTPRRQKFPMNWPGRISPLLFLNMQKFYRGPLLFVLCDKPFLRKRKPHVEQMSKDNKEIKPIIIWRPIAVAFKWKFQFYCTAKWNNLQTQLCNF